MNVFDYLATVTFALTTDGKIDIDKPFNERQIQKVEIPYDHYLAQFSDEGELVKRYPGLFRGEILERFDPREVSTSSARFALSLSLMSNHIYHYQSPRYDNDGNYLFSESEALQQAANMRLSYVLMEDLS